MPPSDDESWPETTTQWYLAEEPEKPLLMVPREALASMRWEGRSLVVPAWLYDLMQDMDDG